MPKRNMAFAVLALMLLIGGTGHAFAQGLQEFDEPPLADPVKGERIFRKCLQCHTVNPDEKKIGPNLAGLIGRIPGSIPDFGYSQDMIDFGNAGNFWNEETLDVFLTKPRNLMQRTKMAFPGLRKEKDRVDLIAYLTNL